MARWSPSLTARLEAVRKRASGNGQHDSVEPDTDLPSLARLEGTLDVEIAGSSPPFGFDRDGAGAGRAPTAEWF